MKVKTSTDQSYWPLSKKFPYASERRSICRRNKCLTKCHCKYNECLTQFLVIPFVTFTAPLEHQPPFRICVNLCLSCLMCLPECSYRLSQRTQMNAEKKNGHFMKRFFTEK
jgi:hypothetical protein